MLTPPRQALFQLTLTAVITGGLAQLADEIFSAMPTHSSRVVRAIELMEKNIGHPLSNPELAEGFHPNSFTRIFKQEMGISPQRYYMRLRLERAALMLSIGEDSLESIAEAVGFWDRNHFTHAFTREWTCPPAEFRRRHRQ